MHMDDATRRAFVERMAKVAAQPKATRAQQPLSWRRGPRAQHVHPAQRGLPVRSVRPRGFGEFQYESQDFPPSPSLPAAVPAPGSIPAPQALALLQARYAQLSKIGAALVQLGTAVPCHVIMTYSKAVNAYLHDGVDLFKQIREQGGQVEQIVFENGQPQRDGAGNFVSQSVTTPLLPPFPVTDPKKCPGYLPFARQLAGFAGAAGFGQAAAAGAIVGALRVAWPYIVRIGTILITTYAVNTVLDKIQVIWRGYNVEPEKALSAYLECVGKLQAGGMAAAQAAEQCGQAVPGKGMSALAWVGLFTVVAVGAGGIAYYFFKKTSPAERERRERIHAADREAEEAHEAAARASSRARRYRAGHFSPEAA